jgi:hypothetical protein
MPDPHPFGALLRGLDLVDLELGLRLGLGLYTLLLALGLWRLTRPALGRPASRPPKERPDSPVCAAHLREEWGGDMAEARWQWCQAGIACWAIRLWTLGWWLQLVGARVRCTLAAVVWAHRWKKP